MLLLGGGDLPIIFVEKFGLRNGLVDRLHISERMLLLEADNRDNLLRLRQSKSTDPTLMQSLSLELDSYAFGLYDCRLRLRSRMLRPFFLGMFSWVSLKLNVRGLSKKSFCFTVCLSYFMSLSKLPSNTLSVL